MTIVTRARTFAPCIFSSFSLPHSPGELGQLLLSLRSRTSGVYICEGDRGSDIFWPQGGRPTWDYFGILCRSYRPKSPIRLGLGWNRHELSSSRARRVLQLADQQINLHLTCEFSAELSLAKRGEACRFTKSVRKSLGCVLEESCGFVSAQFPRRRNYQVYPRRWRQGSCIN
jgi:hypothetical protein